MNTPAKVFIYSFISGTAIIIGGFLGTKKIPDKVLAFILTFGSGVILAVLSFTLMHEAYNHSGPIITSIAFILGGLFFYELEILLEKKFTEGIGITLGTAMDDLPEALSMGIGFASKENLGIILALSIFLHNIPEGLSSTSDLIDSSNFSRKKALLLSILLGLLTPFWALVGYYFLRNIPEMWLGIIMAFSGGAVLFMTGTDMIPKAHRIGNRAVNIGILFGFLIAFLLTKVFGLN
ncbi:Zinc transporter ZupT [Koleobacter methoxysyntrophicus]|jgi:ZIP family zinc transporter|uniref:Zinc transporter ZupT n=1 Tax=Koleobacter methoxysyntrophicus TaxID=2751313 RepID=A0A8A0RNU3_9FIRM|nr:ZIP family metal transporter [Koleobacter methoxysyntrophicus]QSQ09562.1 Zinc transporter ZupT [Koleobacter methoxysyntrophicus]